MTYRFYNRKSIRLQKHNYAAPGIYFVTICTQNRKCLFGEIMHGRLELNDRGNMVQKTWHEIPKYYSNIDIDVCQIMPNHIHGIIIVKSTNHLLAPVGANPRVRPNTEISQNVKTPYQKRLAQDTGQTQGSAPTVTGKISGLPDIIKRFKSLTTKQYIDGIKRCNWPPFDKRLWQRNYHEHIIRNNDELNKIRIYIKKNPTNWQDDQDFDHSL